MPKYARLSKAKIKAAIPGSGGIISVVCRRTGYSWGAVRDFIRNNPDLTAMLDEEQESVDDMAELTLIEKIRKGDEQTARWWLARRRRNTFGDGVNLEVAGKDGGAIEVVLKTIRGVSVDDL